jgi:hypothetical protein
MQPQTPPPESGAPAPPSPEAVVEPQVEIALGPDLNIYPEDLRPQPETAAPPAETLEPDEAAAPESVEDVAGAAVSPQEGETRGTRRRAAEDAYQRGLAEGRTAYEREQQQFAAQQQALQIQRDAQQRVENLFVQARSPDNTVRQQAWNTILQMYDGNRQAQELMSTTRSQVLSDLARDFSSVRELDASMSDADYQQLHEAPTPSELVKRAFDLGKRSREEQIAKLEAELQGVRGRLVGSRATPEARNGQSADMSGTVSPDEYAAMSLKDARKLSSAQIDALTAQMQQLAERNGRSF